MEPVVTSSFASSSLSQRLGVFLSRPSFYLYLTGMLMLAGLLLGHRLSERASLDQLSALATERLELYASNLQTEPDPAEDEPTVVQPGTAGTAK